MAVLPELREEHYEEIIEEASRNLRKDTSGYRGQMITVHCCLDWHVMQVTRNYLQRMIDHEEYLGASVSDV